MTESKGPDEIQALIDLNNVLSRRVADLERQMMEVMQRLQKVDAVSRIRIEPPNPNEKFSSALGKTLREL